MRREINVAAAAATRSEIPPASTKYQTLASEFETVRASRNERWTPSAEMSGTAAKARPRLIPDVVCPAVRAFASIARAEKSSRGTALTKAPLAEVVTMAACLIPATELRSGTSAEMICEAFASVLYSVCSRLARSIVWARTSRRVLSAAAWRTR